MNTEVLEMTATLTRTLPPELQVPLTQLLGENQRYDAHKVAAHLGISLRDLAGLVGRSASSLSRTPDGLETQTYLSPLVAVLSLLHRTGATLEAVNAWLRSPIPGLGYRVPLELIKAGQFERVRAVLEAAFEGDLD